ncbi:MAG: DUF1800 family protein [Burkholderiales bacterium]|nr:DUF1800 family protein [Burkholderiales bacterium]
MTPQVPEAGRRPGHALALAAACITLLLQACGGGVTPETSGGAQSAGQVAPATAAPKVTHYAASRFAEQAAFGPNPALVAELRAKGFEQWIDEQFALPYVPIDGKPTEAVYAYKFNDNIPSGLYSFLDREMVRLSLAAPDQLRVRVMWSLSQFIVTSRNTNQIPGHVVWTNLLYRRAFDQYGQLLRDVTLDPHMGNYLNNSQNRPKSAECPHCAPNENYARELMQLFSIGVLKLNPDGTPQRDSRGRFVETYTQTDVEELARALTGWTFDPSPPNRPERNFANWGKPMVPSTWPPERDAGRKEVMGRVFPAGQSQNKDLDDIIAMLMAHPNIAPFVAQRMIQHLVKSNPTPAYVERVAAKFRDNGSGVAGDMKAVVKATLLDAEARRGDNPATARNDDGKFREPWLHRMATFRGLGCSRNVAYAPNSEWVLSTQTAFHPESVFSFYAPTDRAPGSNLLAPEQRLVDARELTLRLGEMNSLRWNRTLKVNDMQPLRDAGCDVDLFVQAYTRSPKDFLDLLSERYFRGAMPPTLRNNLEQMIRQPTWSTTDMSEGAMRMLAFALSTPTFGVIK